MKKKRTRSKKAIELYDTTLRDGSQSEGISFSVKDKIRISEKLDALGVRFIEGGWPGSNPKDMAYFKEAKKLKLKNAQIVAFGSTRRAHTKASRDPNLAELVKAGTQTVTIFGKSWDLHVRDALKTSLQENLAMIEDSIKFLKSKGREVIYDAEHFFDGYKANPKYALETLKLAEKAGARTIVLCDTNGGALPSEVASITKVVRRAVTTPLGVHTHNDAGCAVANALSAVEGGARHVQGTINGCGERCGNSDLIQVIANLELKLGYHCVGLEHLKHLTEVSHFVSEVTNMILQNNQPYVGRSAFAHKGGIHINAVLKNPQTYEHVKPESVGGQRRFLTSELAGKSGIILKARDLRYELSKDAPKTKRIHRLIQRLESEGYQFEAAEASLELLIHKTMKRPKKFFELVDYKTVVLSDESGKTLSEATVRVKVKDLEEHTAALGDGPVNALDNALRKALIPFYPQLKTMRLSDFKVRVLDQKSGTAAKVRVFVESTDETGSWTTVGISENIIEASWKALVDSVEYKLLKR